MKSVVKESKKHLDLYDWLRFIATIFVIIGHSAYLSMQSSYGQILYELPVNLSDAYNSPILEFFRNLIDWIYSFHMPLFFMLSGAVLAIKPIKSFDKVVSSKIKRLIIPYVVYGCLFMIPVKLFSNFYTIDNLNTVYSAYLSGIEGSHLWFLLALFWCIILFVFLHKLFQKWNINSLYFLLMVTGLIQLIHSSIPFDILYLQMGLDYIFWFTLGYVFEVKRKEKMNWSLKKTIIYFILFLIIEILNSHYSFLNTFFAIIFGAFFTYLLANFCSKVFKKFTSTKTWEIIVRNLFNIYLFHDPLNYVILKIFMSHNYLTTSIGCYLFIFLRIVGVFGISILLGEIVRGTCKSINYFWTEQKNASNESNNSII